MGAFTHLGFVGTGGGFGPITFVHAADCVAVLLSEWIGQRCRLNCQVGVAHFIQFLKF